MPIYDYECRDCGQEQERIFNIEEKPSEIGCPICRGTAHPIISFNGGVKTEHPTWLDESVRWAIQTEPERHVNPVQTRSQYERVLREKNFVPVD